MKYFSSVQKTSCKPDSVHPANGGAGRSSLLHGLPYLPFHRIRFTTAICRHTAAWALTLLEFASRIPLVRDTISPLPVQQVIPAPSAVYFLLHCLWVLSRAGHMSRVHLAVTLIPGRISRLSTSLAMPRGVRTFLSGMLAGATACLSSAKVIEQ